MSKPVKVYIYKAKQNLEVDVDRIPQTAWNVVVINGLEAILMKRMSRYHGLHKLEGEKLLKAQLEVMKCAKENLDALYNGHVKYRNHVDSLIVG